MSIEPASPLTYLNRISTAVSEDEAMLTDNEVQGNTTSLATILNLLSALLHLNNWFPKILVKKLMY